MFSGNNSSSNILIAKTLKKKVPPFSFQCQIILVIPEVPLKSILNLFLMGREEQQGELENKTLWVK